MTNFLCGMTRPTTRAQWNIALRYMFTLCLLFAALVAIGRGANSAPPEPAFQNIIDNPRLPRVLLIGDSISIGYTLPVRALLRQRANVHRPATNCQGTRQGLIGLDKWLGKEPWDIIHFNFGIHDLKYVGPIGELRPPQYGKRVSTAAQYETNLRSIVARLKQTKAKLIWCSTTPIASNTLGFVQGEEVQFNAIARKIMAENDILIDDLHAVAAPRLSSIQLPTNVHFTSDGYQFLGTAVASSIAAALPPSPSITSLSKSEGPLNSSLTINGDNFADARTVRFNGVEAPDFTVLSAKQIQVTVPSLATTGKVSVTTHGGTAISAANFRITPAITGFTPASGPAGTLVEITGTTLSGVRELSFNGVTAPVIFGMSTFVRAKVPPTATTGAIRVVTPNGTATSPLAFQVTPQFIRFTPARGPVGTTVTITGTGLSDIRSIAFNGQQATFSALSPTTVQAQVPTEATSGKILVTTASGTASSHDNFLVVPTLTGFSPSSGTVGSTITVNGTALTAVTAVTLNGIKTRFTRLSPSQLEIVVPPNATSGRISLITSTGNVTSAASFAVLPQILNFTPTRGRAGTIVTILGTGFNTVRLVSINGQACRFTVLSPTRISAIAPPRAGTGPIQVVTTAGLSTSSGTFTILPTPPKRSEGTSADSTASVFPAISTITPDAATGSIRLTFLQEPQPELVNDPASYRVTIDGTPIAVQSVTYSTGTAILVLPVGAIKEGSQVTVQWRQPESL